MSYNREAIHPSPATPSPTVTPMRKSRAAPAARALAAPAPASTQPASLPACPPSPDPSGAPPLIAGEDGAAPNTSSSLPSWARSSPPWTATSAAPCRGASSRSAPSTRRAPPPTTTASQIRRVCKIALRGLAACATARRDFAHAVGPPTARLHTLHRAYDAVVLVARFNQIEG